MKSWVGEIEIFVSSLKYRVKVVNLNTSVGEGQFEKVALNVSLDLFFRLSSR